MKNRSAMENFKDEYEYSRGKYIVPQKELEEFIEGTLKLLKENQQLKDNWNKLKAIVKSQSDFKQKLGNDRVYFEIDELLDKIQELEKGDSNE